MSGVATTIRARLAPGRSVDTHTFADLTDSPLTVGWGDDGLLEVTFDADLDTATRRAVRIRLIADDATEEALMSTLAAIMGETPATAEDRIDRLERAVLALAKLELRDQT